MLCVPVLWFVLSFYNNSGLELLGSNGGWCKELSVMELTLEKKLQCALLCDFSLIRHEPEQLLIEFGFVLAYSLHTVFVHRILMFLWHSLVVENRVRP